MSIRAMATLNSGGSVRTYSKRRSFNPGFRSTYSAAILAQAFFVRPFALFVLLSRVSSRPPWCSFRRCRSEDLRFDLLVVTAWRRATAKTPKIRHVRRHAISGAIGARSEGVPRQTEQKMSSTRCRTYAILAGTARHQRQMDDQQSPAAGLPEPKWSPLADPSARQQLTLRTSKATGNVALNKLLIQRWLGAPDRSPPTQRRPQHSSEMPQTNMEV